MKGDRVEVVVDVGDGTRTYEIEATRAGRRLEVTNVRGAIEVAEVTRTGVVVKTARFMAARVVALIEHPAEDEQQARPAGRRSRNQASLL
jgi:precorrin-6B methylase 2